MQIVGIVAAPFTAGASLYLAYAATIWSGVQAAQAGQFGAWAAGFAVSLALGGLLPTPSFENLFVQIGAGALRGAVTGAISGGIASVVSGGSFGEGAAYGAMGGAGGGAISAFATSQQFTNSAEGYGFKSNNDVIDALGREGKFQEAIDFASKRYDLPSGSYDPNNPNFGVTDMTTGKVTYGSLAFSGRSQLQATGFHEGRHVWQVKMNKVIFDWSKSDPIVNRYALEIDAGKQTLSNAWKLNLTKQAIQDERAYLRENQIKASWTK